MFRKENSASVNFMLSAALWAVVGVLLGSVLALQSAFPHLFRGVSWLILGRLHQAYTDTILFAWLSGAMIGLWLYIVPHLTGRRLWNEKLGHASAVVWNLALLAGITGILAGKAQSREYAEFIWGIDVAVVAALLLNLANVLMTVRHRTEPKLYVSLWYILGAAIWFPVLYFIGNAMWNPPSGALAGLNGTIVDWFYSHDVVGLWLTTGLLAVVCYVVPREARTALYSHFLCLVGFWAMAFFYAGAGGLQLLWAPLSPWLDTLTVVANIGLTLAAMVLILSITMTLRGTWKRFLASIPLRFVVTGWVAYILVTSQQSYQALHSINLMGWLAPPEASATGPALLLFATFTLMGGIYYVLPRIYKCQVFSRKLANIGYGLFLSGSVLFFGGSLLAQPAWSLLPVLSASIVLWAPASVLLALGLLVFSYNVLATALARKPISQPVVTQVRRSTTVSPAPAMGS
jgi:cbb3-type cytochrome c oxidase subunit I